MIRYVDTFSLLVPSYEKALAFFYDALGFAIVEDSPLTGGKCRVVFAATGGLGANIVLAVPIDDRQRARVGDQTGGRVGYFLQTGDFDRDYHASRARSVRLLEAPSRDPTGSSPSFPTLWGGSRSLIQPTPAVEAPA